MAAVLTRICIILVFETLLLMNLNNEDLDVKHNILGSEIERIFKQKIQCYLNNEIILLKGTKIY